LFQHVFCHRLDRNASGGGEFLEITVFGHGGFCHKHFPGTVWAVGERFADRLWAFDQKQPCVVAPRFFGELGYSADAR
jgi:hypothetical protein